MLRFLAAATLIACVVRASAEEPKVIDRLRTDLTFLASPQCEGRGPGTAGIDKAADYVAESFRKSGVKPAMPDGSYFQPFTFKGSPTLGDDVAFEWTTADGPKSLALGKEFQVHGLSAKGKATGGLAFVGYGLAAPEAKYDDFADIDVAGKVVLMIRKTPKGPSADKPFVDEATRDKIAPFAAKFGAAQKRHAAAVVIVNDRDEKDDPLGDFRQMIFAEPMEIPIVQVKRAVADALLRSATGKSLVEIEEAIDATRKPMSRLLDGCSAKLSVSVERKTLGIKNVVGVLDGNGPLKDQTVVIGAHYDHLGYGGGGSLAIGVKAIHYGADDNASGTTALLELARRFGAMKDRQGRRLVFIAFSGEEVNLLGSAHYVKEPIFPLADTTLMVNLDMVGRMIPDEATGKPKIEIGGTGTAKGFSTFLDALNRKYDFAIKKTVSGVGPSDHTSFYMKGVPVYFFFTGIHKEYHRPSDTIDLINFAGMAKIVDMVDDVVTIQAAASEKPEYVKQAISASAGGRGNVPRIGIMPGDYDEDAGGVPVASVTKDGPADKGGLKDGDRIVAIGGKTIKNMTGYMEAMMAQKRGSPVEITVDRKGTKVNLTVTPQ